MKSLVNSESFLLAFGCILVFRHILAFGRILAFGHARTFDCAFTFGIENVGTRVEILRENKLAVHVGRTALTDIFGFKDGHTLVRAVKQLWIQCGHRNLFGESGEVEPRIHESKTLSHFGKYLLGPVR